jgi:hypothetical protein
MIVLPNPDTERRSDRGTARLSFPRGELLPAKMIRLILTPTRYLRDPSGRRRRRGGSVLALQKFT